MAFAGRFAPREHGDDPGRGALERALARDGPAETATLGPLAVGWVPAVATPGDGERTLCVIDGRPRTAELARELGIDPSSPAGTIVARGFERLGHSVVERLGGEFALLVWNSERGAGVLARDRLGHRPLFLAESRGTLLFGSEVRNLLAMLPRRPAPDATAMRNWLARTRVLDDRTLYEGITRLPAMHLLTLERGGWQRRRYWQPSYSRPSAITREEAGEKVRAGIESAVARALEGATRPAVMLSGGLDSAAVASVASPERELAAYSAVFPEDPEVDESAGIARVRGWLGLGGVEERFAGASALAATAEFIREWELPSLSPNLFVWSPLLRHAAADGIDVVLDGEGGDELFGCARYLIADRLRRRGPLPALRLARRLPGMGDEPRPRWLLRAITAYGIRPALPAPVHRRMRALRRRGVAGPDWLREDEERRHREADDPWMWKALSGPRWWADLAHTLTSGSDAMGSADQLRREARLTGVELRHPLRDPELVELALGLPPELAFDPHLDRPLVRRALARDLPPETLRDDRKPAFNSLLDAALGGPDSAAVESLLSDPHPELARMVRDDALKVLNRPPADGRARRRWATEVWRLASLEMWLRHGEDPGSVTALLAVEENDARITFERLPAKMRQLRDDRHPGGSAPT